MSKRPRRKRRSYHQAVDGEWFAVPKRGYREQCCDCAKVHRVNFRINAAGQIEIQAFSDHRATNGARSKFHFTGED